jgi:anti-sigma-K factor RskA
MSGSETTHSPLEGGDLAFEYVSGVMRGAERHHFEQRLASDESLQIQVRFWEEQLMNLSDQQEGVTPDPEVWSAIEARVQKQRGIAAEPVKSRFAWLWQGVSAFASLMLAVCVWLLVARAPLDQPNADYVAVLTDPSGTPQLTVLTATGGEQLWLKWETVKIAEDKNLQLWAISKRDGQIRPLGVFAQTDSVQLPLNEANWRLIKDASHLILTEEDIGGSPLDEPSDVILAKGACVLLARIDKTI